MEEADPFLETLPLPAEGENSLPNSGFVHEDLEYNLSIRSLGWMPVINSVLISTPFFILLPQTIQSIKSPGILFSAIGGAMVLALFFSFFSLTSIGLKNGEIMIKRKLAGITLKKISFRVENWQIEEGEGQMIFADEDGRKVEFSYRRSGLQGIWDKLVLEEEGESGRILTLAYSYENIGNLKMKLRKALSPGQNPQLREDF